MTSEASASTATKPRRRWLQFSLRTLLVVMFLFALAAGWLGYHIQKGRDQLAAIAWVEAQGGKARWYVDSFPRWQRSWLRDWYPDEVIDVDLSGTKTSQVAPLTPFTYLEALRLSETPVDDISPLAAHRELLFLDLTGTHIKEEQVVRLQESLPKLIIWQPAPVPQPEWRLREWQGSDLQVVDAHDNILWNDTETHEQAGNAYLMGETLSDSHLYFSTITTLRCLDLASGQVVWRQERQISCLQYLQGSLFGMEGFQSIRDGVLFGLDAATGEEFLRMDLGEGVREVRLRAKEGHLVVNYATTDARVSRVLDPQGNLRASFSQPCYDLLLEGEDLICGLADSVQRVAPDQEILWSVPLTTVSPQQEESLYLLAGGELVVLNYDAHHLDELEVKLIEPSTGRVRWSTIHVLPLPLTYPGLRMPVPSQSQQWKVGIAQNGNRFVVIAQANNPPGGPVIYLHETSTGMPIGLWDFNNDW